MAEDRSIWTSDLNRETTAIAVILIAFVAVLVIAYWPGHARQSETLPATAAVDSSHPDFTTVLSPECGEGAALACDGIYRVGDVRSSAGITPGWIRTAGPWPAGQRHCTWTRLSGPDLTLEDTLSAGDAIAGPATVQIKPSDYAFATYGCQPWHKLG